MLVSFPAPWLLRMGELPTALWRVMAAHKGKGVDLGKEFQGPQRVEMTQSKREGAELQKQESSPLQRRTMIQLFAQ